MARFVIVSEDFDNRGASWTFRGVYRTSAVTARVEIRANAYREQSHAAVATWGVGGWNVHTSLPVADWYDLLPSYTRRELTYEDRSQFRWLGTELLERLADALWGDTDGVAYDDSDRVSDFEQMREGDDA
jgi:hypothetical protein